MGWFKKLIQFWKDNLEANIIRISIAIGAFLSFVITLIPIPDVWKGATIILLTLVIMSLFGKNGNGHIEEVTE